MVPPLVKVCGLTDLAEALACAEAGVDWMGLNFHPSSPRKVEPTLAASIAAALPEHCTPVGLFVDRTPEDVADIAARVGLKVVQLHGNEPPEILQALPGLRVVKAFRLGNLEMVARMVRWLEEADTLGRVPEAVLIDGYVSGQAGGTGQAIAVDVLDHLPPLPRLILAGGLTDKNVAERVKRVRPWMVDVASGVESTPGRKDPAKVRKFVAASRG